MTMDLIRLFVLFLFVFDFKTTCSIHTAYLTRVDSFSNRIIETNILSVSVNIPSVIHCHLLCLKDLYCVSVFYRASYKQCQLHDVLFLSAEDGDEDNGTQYYSIYTEGCLPHYVNVRALDLCYRHIVTSMYVDEAIAECASRGEHLISIHNQEQQDHFKKQINASSVAVVKSYLIDGNDLDIEGAWRFSDGTPMSYFSWEPGYPRNITTHNYIVAAKRYDFNWQDSQITSRKYIMCEIDI